MGEQFTYTASVGHRCPFGQPCPDVRAETFHDATDEIDAQLADPVKAAQVAAVRTEMAREDVRAEAREQIARWLSAAIDRPLMWDRSDEAYRDRYRADADDLATAAGIAEALAAVEKVRKLATDYAQIAKHLHHVPSAELYAEVATELRRALGEDGQ